MSEESPSPETGSKPPPKTPFDNPLFLPVMLWIFTAWFTWDAWIVPMQEHLAFNRYGFFVTFALAVWFTRRGLRERRQDREAERDSASGG